MINRLIGVILLIVVSSSCMAFTIANKSNLRESSNEVNFFITIQPNIYATSKEKGIYKVEGLDNCRIEIEIAPGVKGACDDNIMFKVRYCFMQKEFVQKKIKKAFIYEYMVVGIRVSGKDAITKKTYFRDATLTEFIKCNIKSIFDFEISDNIGSLVPTIIINDGEYILNLEPMYSIHW